MPDTTIREGWLQPGSPSYSDDWLVYGRAPRKTDEPCVVVTGRTAQETREAFELLDNRNRIFPGCVRDA